MGEPKWTLKKKSIYLCLVALGFHCCQWAFSSCDVWGLLCCGAQASPAVTFLVGEHSLWSGKASVVVAHRLSCSVACEIFPDQGWNLCPLCWPKISYPLCHQGNPQINFLANPIIIWRRCRLHWLFWASLVAQRLKKKSACNADDIRDLGSIPGSGWSLAGGNGNLLQYSCLENSMNRGAWRATVHGVAKSQRSWSWISNTLATWCAEPTHWKRPRAGGEAGSRGWDGWMASVTQWTQVWVNSGRDWRIGKPGMLQSMGLQRVRHDLVTEQ